MELTETIVLDKDKRSAVLYPPTMPTKVFVYATGAGCATIQGQTTFSTYATRERTALLEIRAEIAEEIAADHSSLEEIEGKLPSLKIRTCLRWKGDKPSPVIRLEHTLFSGFEVTAPPPQLEGQHDKMAAMEHGSHGDAAWFVFANVTSPCPVCVRFHARTPYVISGLRPAYAQAYPVGRPDLTVGTFYHARDRNSLLLRAVSGDDLIAWFGAEGARVREPDASCVSKTKNATRRHQVARVNTAKLPTRPVQVDKPSNEYVLLDKESLWDLIKEAVNDDVKRKELSNMLRETDD